MRFFLTLFLLFNILQVYGVEHITVSNYETQINDVFLLLAVPENYCSALDESVECINFLTKTLLGNQSFSDLDIGIANLRKAHTTELKIKEFIQNFFRQEFTKNNQVFNKLLTILSTWKILKYPNLVLYLFLTKGEKPKHIIIEKLRRLIETLKSPAFIETVSDVYYLHVSTIKSIP